MNKKLLLQPNCIKKTLGKFFVNFVFIKFVMQKHSDKSMNRKKFVIKSQTRIANIITIRRVFAVLIIIIIIIIMIIIIIIIKIIIIIRLN